MTHPAQTPPEHVILVAFTAHGETRQDAERVLFEAVGLKKLHERGHLGVSSWWEAEDDRVDGSDCDSAVFVHPGAQAQAIALLRAAGLTAECNDWDETREVRGQFDGQAV